MYLNFGLSFTFADQALGVWCKVYTCMCLICMWSYSRSNGCDCV